MDVTSNDVQRQLKISYKKQELFLINTQIYRSFVSRKLKQEKSNYVGRADRNISHASILDLLCVVGEGCGVSEGCSVRQAPAKQEKRGGGKKEKEEEERAESKEGAGWVDRCVLCADRCVKRGPYCTGGDKWILSEEAKHVPLLPLYSSKII